MLIRLFFIGLVTSLLVFSCKNQQEEIIDFEDLIATDVDDGLAHDEDPAKPRIDSIEILLNDFKDHGIPVKSLEMVNTSLFPDRFGPSKSEGYKIYTENDSLSLCRWVYTDSSKTMNAFFNWMDCFGKTCKSVYIGEEVNLQKQPFVIYANDTVLFFVEAKNDIDVQEWENYLWQKEYAKDWNFVIEQRRWGKLKWFTYIEEEKLKYTE